MSISFQLGQDDFELAACDGRVLLAPYVGTPPLFDIEDAVNGGIDQAKVGAGSKFLTVGNYEKRAGVKLSNKPTINKIMSSGKGSPTRNLPSEAPKGITYTPQQMTLLNLQNSWGFTPDAVSSVSAKGGFTIAIPELPARLQWRCVYLVQDYFNGKPIYMYWIANKAEVGDRDDISGVDSDVLTHGVSLEFLTDNAVGDPVIFGMCGDGLQDLVAAGADGTLYPAATGITVAPATAALTVAAGANHTKQLTVTDSNGLDRTAVATFVSADQTKATVSTTGLVTAVATTTSAVNVTATYMGHSAQCAVSVS